MMTLTAILLGSAFVALAFAQTTTETRKVSGFNGVYSSGPFEITLAFGKKEGVKVEADPSIIKYVETVVDNGYLKVKFADAQPGPIKYSGTINVFVTAKAISNIQLDSSGNLKTSPEAVLRGTDLQIITSGSGQVTAKVNVNNLNSVISGSGDHNMNGKVKNLNVAASSSGSFNGEFLKAQQVNIAIQSSGNVAVYCENDLSVWIAGSGSVVYGGNPTVNPDIPGTGTITRAGPEGQDVLDDFSQ